MNKANSKSKAFVDINSEGLREVLKIVLKDIKWISLGGDKPAVYALDMIYQAYVKLTNQQG